MLHSIALKREGLNWTSVICPVMSCHTVQNMGRQGDANIDVNGRLFVSV